MHLLNDRQIKHLHTGDKWMINPFVPHDVRELNGKKCVSYGLSSVGYDIRTSDNFSRPLDFSSDDKGQVKQNILDPHALGDVVWTEEKFDSYVLQPGEMILGASFEYFTMPDDVCAICLGKSTYARMGLFVNVTPLEPGWKGILTMELSNIGHVPLRIYAMEGIAQLIFFQIARPSKTYADKGGKYQGQTGVTAARL